MQHYKFSEDGKVLTVTYRGRSKVFRSEVYNSSAEMMDAAFAWINNVIAEEGV